MLNLGQQAHFCLDGQIKLESWMAFELNLDVLLLLTKSVWTEVNIARGIVWIFLVSKV